MIRQGAAEDESRLSIRYAVLRTLLLAVLVFVGYSVVMRLTMAVFPMYINYLYGTWSDSNYFASLLKTLINIVFLIVGAIVLRGRRLTYSQRFSIIMLGLSIIFQVLSMRMEIWGRIAGLFSIYVYLMWVPDFLDEINLKRNRWIVECAVVFFSYIYMIIVLVFRPEWNLVVPYVVR